MKTLSIVMPIYNGENYIDISIPSILNQQESLDKIELIIINDGSKDGSIIKLQKYATEYPHTIRLIDRENKGAAASRNEGLQLATGEYVTFMDQDDSIDPDYVSTLLGAAIEADVDVLHTGYKLVDDTGTVHQTIFPKRGKFALLFSIPAWAKIYKKIFLVDNKISFFKNNIGEDNVFTLQILLSNPKYKRIEYAGYNNAYENLNSVTNSLHKGLSEKVQILQLLKELHKFKATDTPTQTVVNYNVVRTAAYYLLSYGKNASPNRFSEVAKELLEWIDGNIPGWRKNRNIWIPPRGESLSATIGVKLLVALYSLNALPLFARLYCREDPQ